MKSILRKIKDISQKLQKKSASFTLLKKLYVYRKNVYNYHNISFAQEGEDRILSRLLTNQKSGFYVDVGAHHPQRFSNTYYFYLQGWQGINIDAMPGSMIDFNKIRPRDINLELAIAEIKESLTYYGFNEPALNSFCQDTAEEYMNSGTPLLFKKEIETHSLAEVLDNYLPENQTIDFLSIDVEGLDYQVLKSNNWQKYRPKIVLIEVLGLNSLEEAQETEVYLFLKQKQYHLYGKTVNTLIFRDLQI